MLSALASRENTADFQRGGKDTKVYSRIVAFFNSAIQGTDSMARAFKRNPALFMLRAGLWITLPSILFYLMNRDDEEYQEMPQYQKDMFWMFKTGKTWWKIPTPYEAGMLFGALPVRALEFFRQNDKKAFDGWAEQFLANLSPNFLPTAVMPWLEVSFNYDSFRNIPIVPESEKYRRPEEQFNAYTSSLAKALGRLLKQSPRQIDHLIGGYGAGLGKELANWIGKGLEQLGIVEKRVEPEKSLAQKLPIIKGLTTEAYRNSKSIDDFYTILDEMESTYKRTRDKEGIELNQYKDRKKLRAMRKAQEELRDLNREYMEVYTDNKMDAKTKREKLSKINLERINVARKALGKPKIRE
jgi:hypothetical protein